MCSFYIYVICVGRSASAGKTYAMENSLKTYHVRFHSYRTQNGKALRFFKQRRSLANNNNNNTTTTTTTTTCFRTHRAWLVVKYACFFSNSPLFRMIFMMLFHLQPKYTSINRARDGHACFHKIPKGCIQAVCILV